MKIKILITALLLVLPLSNSFGFDGNREGYVLGLGFGLNGNKLVHKSAGTETIEHPNGFSTVVRTGYGLDNQLILYIERVDGFFYLNDNDVLWNSSLTGIGLDYYFYNLPSSPYFSVSYGYGEQRTVSEKGYSNYHGDAYRIGIGYQSETHLGVEISGIRKELRKGSTTLTVDTVLLSFTVLLF